MDDEKKQKRLENLAKARQRIMELRAEKEKLSNKSKKDEKKDEPVEKVVESSKNVEEKTTNDVDKVDTKTTVKEPVEEPDVEEPVEKPKVEEPIKKVKKTYVKKEKPIVEKTEAIVIENKPVKLTFSRGNDGLWYM